jgi:chromate transporter
MSGTPVPGARAASPPDAETPGLAGVSRAALFAGSLKVGLLGFGGVMPLARRVFVDERGWLTDREFAQLIGMSQVLPGPNVVNLSVIIGSRAQGPVGALLALSGILFVPAVVVVVLATFYASVSRETWARNAIAAGSAAGAGLILGTATRLVVQTRPPWRGLLMGAAAFVSIGVLQWPLLVVLPALVAVAIAWEWHATPR